MLLLQQIVNALRPVVSIDVEHDLVHRGRMWHFSLRAASVANNANLDLLLVTGAQRPHIVITGRSGGNAWGLLFEGPTTSAPGTAVPIYNMQRGTVGTPLLTVTSAPTVTDTGTELDGVLMAGGSGGQAGGAQVRLATEWILAANTAYLLRLTNIAGTAQPASIAVEFYEEVGS